MNRLSLFRYTDISRPLDRTENDPTKSSGISLAAHSIHTLSLWRGPWEYPTTA